MALGELLEIMYSNGSSYFLKGKLILKPMKSILHITKNNSTRNVIRSQYLTYIGHVCRCPNTTLTNKMMPFAKSRRLYKRDPWINIAKLIKCLHWAGKEVYNTQDRSGFAALVDRVMICNRQCNSMVTGLSPGGF